MVKMIKACLAGVGLVAVLSAGQAVATTVVPVSSTYDENVSFIILTCAENGKGGISVVSSSAELSSLPNMPTQATVGPQPTPLDCGLVISRLLFDNYSINSVTIIPPEQGITKGRIVYSLIQNLSPAAPGPSPT